MAGRIRLGTRPSLLALKQVEEIKRHLPYLYFEIVSIETEGDRDKVTPLAGIESSDFFTYDIEKALFDNKFWEGAPRKKSFCDTGSI